MEQQNQLIILKEQLYSDIDKRVTDRILEPENAKLLKKLINQAETHTEALDIAALGTMYKRTGLHFDPRFETSNSDDIHYFKKNEELSFHTDETKPVNKLIIGDNYSALQNLLIQYRSKIDVIYIDPPYGKDSLGEHAQTNYQNAISRDNLLSMMYPRLILAKQLLSQEGVIFCSIDDKNQAYVKCLFDEVFGEKNSLGTIIWKSATDNNIHQITTEHEYILCYAQNEKIQNKWIIQSDNAKLIKEKYFEILQDTKDINEIQTQLVQWMKENAEKLKGVMHYNKVDERGVYTANTNSSNTKPGGYMFDIIHPKTKQPCAKPAFGWRFPEETFKQNLKNGDVIWGKDETTKPIIKKRIETVVGQFKSIYYEDSRNATFSLENILMRKKIFDNPKPISLLKNFFRFVLNDDAKILDFYAGSGSTGHAVLDADIIDGSNRTFILCQLDEITDTTPNGIAHDVTTKRLKRIMTGECYDGTKDFDWLKKNKPYGGNLDVYDISTVSKNEQGKGKCAFDVIDETLYGKTKFTSLKEKIDWVCNNFEATQKVLKEKE